MSEKIFEKDTTSVTIFNGGNERGPCVQIDWGDSYVQVSITDLSQIYQSLFVRGFLKLGLIASKPETAVY